MTMGLRVSAEEEIQGLGGVAARLKTAAEVYKVG